MPQFTFVAVALMLGLWVWDLITGPYAYVIKFILIANGINFLWQIFKPKGSKW